MEKITSESTALRDLKEQESIGHKQVDKGQEGQPSGVDPILLAYLCIFESVQIGTMSLQVEVKQLTFNRDNQNNLINQEAVVNFKTLPYNELNTYDKKKHKWVPKTVAPQVLDEFEAQNQRISGIRGILEDEITSLRQGAQIGETQINTNMDNSNQSIQQGTSLMQMLTSLTNQISRV